MKKFKNTESAHLCADLVQSHSVLQGHFRHPSKFLKLIKQIINF